MYGTNIVILCGTLGRQPEYLQFPNNSEVTNFTIATTDPTDKSAIWHRIVAKGTLAGICAERLQKGSIVTVQGHIKYRKYIDQATNSEKEVAEIIAHKIDILPDHTNRNASHFEHPAEDQHTRNGFGHQNQNHVPRTSAPQYNKPFNNANQYTGNQGYQNRPSNQNHMNRNRDSNQGDHNYNNSGFQNYPKNNSWPSNHHSQQEEKDFHYQPTVKK